MTRGSSRPRPPAQPPTSWPRKGMASLTSCQPYRPQPASRGCPALELASQSGFWKILALMNSRSSGLGAAASPESCKGKFTRTAKNHCREGDTPARRVTYSRRIRRRTGRCCSRCCQAGRWRGWFPSAQGLLVSCCRRRPLPIPSRALRGSSTLPDPAPTRAKASREGRWREEQRKAGKGPEADTECGFLANGGTGHGEMEKEEIK